MRNQIPLTPDMKLLFYPGRRDDEPYVCPIGLGLWRSFRSRNPNGRTAPPICAEDCSDPELLAYWPNPNHQPTHNHFPARQEHRLPVANVPL
jgi:hypothetical protein